MNLRPFILSVLILGNTSKLSCEPTFSPTVRTAAYLMYAAVRHAGTDEYSHGTKATLMFLETVVLSAITVVFFSKGVAFIQDVMNKSRH